MTPPSLSDSQQGRFLNLLAHSSHSSWRRDPIDLPMRRDVYSTERIDNDIISALFCFNRHWLVCVYIYKHRETQSATLVLPVLLVF